MGLLTGCSAEAEGRDDSVLMISIVIPVYNASGFLHRAVESVCADPGTDWELILVNDGSRDGSGLLCDGYAARDSRVRAVHQENRGPGGARNTGLEHARGEYLFFVDSDDGLNPGALDTVRRALARWAPDILTFDYLADGGHGESTPRTANLAPKNTPFRLEEHPEFLNSMPATWARVWKRSLYLDNSIRYPDRAFYGEDLQTSGKLFALADSVVYIPERLYRYLDRPGSLMNTADPERNRHMLTAVGELLDWYESRGLRTKYEDQLCELAVEHLLMAATVRVAKAAPGAPLLDEIRRFMDRRFPGWKENPCIGKMSALRSFALYLIEHRCYRLLGWLFRMKG